MRRAAFTLLGVGLLFQLSLRQSALADGASTEVGEQPRAEIVDGAHNGNPRFYFLPPMVPVPSTNGVVDPSLSPAIEICEWDGVECASPFIKRFSASEIHVDTTAYTALWDTNESNVQSGKTYRIRVLLDTRVLGHGDVIVTGGGNDARRADNGDAIVLVNGRTLPIRFRLEQGVNGVLPFTSIGMGAEHICGLILGGAAYCWGNGSWAFQLGTGFPQNPDALYVSPTPLAVVGGLAFTSLGVGGWHNCGVAEGELYCWGNRVATGLEATGGFSGEGVPVHVPIQQRFSSLTAGMNATCGLTHDGSAHCMGASLRDDGSTVVDWKPVEVSGGLRFRSIVPGHRGLEICAISDQNAAFCWGENDLGQLGNGTYTNSAVPVAVAGGIRFTRLSSTGYLNAHWCGISETDAAYCWGWNRDGQLGDGTTVSSAVPVRVAGEFKFKAISVGSIHTCAITTTGNAMCWGGGVIGGQMATTTPTLVSAVLVFTEIAAGEDAACGITANRAVYCWGGLWNYTAGAVGGTLTPVLVSP